MQAAVKVDWCSVMALSEQLIHGQWNISMYLSICYLGLFIKDVIIFLDFLTPPPLSSFLLNKLIKQDHLLATLPPPSPSIDDVFYERPRTHFSLYFSGKCNSYQRNSFSINIDHIKLDATGYWIYVNTSHMDYYRFYKYNFAFSNDTLLKSFDHGSFTLKARIDASCAAILRIQFFHNLDSYRNPLAR